MKTNEQPRAADSAHTPGPWHYERPYGEPGHYISGPNTGLIAKLYEPDAHLFNVDKPVSIEANARLIAAAPELLAVVRSFAATYGSLPFADRFRFAATAEQAADAIAKAEGRTS